MGNLPKKRRTTTKYRERVKGYPPKEKTKRRTSSPCCGTNCIYQHWMRRISEPEKQDVAEHPGVKRTGLL